MLSLNAISIIEGVSETTLRRNYSQTEDIYEAIRITKQHTKLKIEYNGEMLTLNEIAQKEGISFKVLRRIYSITSNIYESVKMSKSTSRVRRYEIEQIEYYGEKMTLEKIAEKEGIDVTTLNRYYKKTGDIYDAVEQYLEDSRRKVQRIEYKNGEKLAISVIAKREGIEVKVLTSCYKEVGDIFEAVKICKEKAKNLKERAAQAEQNDKEEYYGQRLRLREIAKIEGIDANDLRMYFRDTKDVYKAVFMAKHQKQKEKIVDYPGISVDLYDLSLLIGVKYTYLINLLNEGMSIAEIKEKYANHELAGENIRLRSGRTLLEFCTSKRLKLAFMYRAIYTYGKSLKDASTACTSNSKSIPTNWIYEKYDKELNELGMSGAQAAAISYDLQHKKVSLDEAIEGCIVRKNARKNNISGEWGEVLYGLVQTRKLLGQEFHSEIKINENEMAFLEACETDLKPQGAANPITPKKEQETRF